MFFNVWGWGLAVCVSQCFPGGMKQWRLSKKGVIPHLIRSFFEREAKSPFFVISRRCRIGVRHDEIFLCFSNFSPFLDSLVISSAIREADLVPLCYWTHWSLTRFCFIFTKPPHSLKPKSAGGTVDLVTLILNSGNQPYSKKVSARGTISDSGNLPVLRSVVPTALT